MQLQCNDDYAIHFTTFISIKSLDKFIFSATILIGSAYERIFEIFRNLITYQRKSDNSESSAKIWQILRISQFY